MRAPVRRSSAPQPVEERPWRDPRGQRSNPIGQGSYGRSHRKAWICSVERSDPTGHLPRPPERFPRSGQRANEASSRPPSRLGSCVAVRYVQWPNLCHRRIHLPVDSLDRADRASGWGANQLRSTAPETNTAIARGVAQCGSAHARGGPSRYSLPCSQLTSMEHYPITAAANQIARWRTPLRSMARVIGERLSTNIHRAGSDGLLRCGPLPGSSRVRSSFGRLPIADELSLSGGSCAGAGRLGASAVPSSGASRQACLSRGRPQNTQYEG